ncbi:MAG: hypothetical protein ACLQMH_11625 [Solirubrobacteraceae bacterium]
MRRIAGSRDPERRARGTGYARGVHARAASAALLLAIGCMTAVGCGVSTVAERTARQDTSPTTVGAGSARAGEGSDGPSADSATKDPGSAATGGVGVTSGAVSAQARIAARVDEASDAVLAEGKVQIAQGAPSDAEVRREIKALRKAGVVLPSGESVQSFEKGAIYTHGSGPQVETPETPWNPRFKPIADWIIPVLQWASLHGWTGTVTSGYRTYYEQSRLNAAGDFSAPAGSSNHETSVYPGGAVDVTEPSELISVLRSYPGPEKLVGGVLGPADPEHFSATGD